MVFFVCVDIRMLGLYLYGNAARMEYQIPHPKTTQTQGIQREIGKITIIGKGVSTHANSELCEHKLLCTRRLHRYDDIPCTTV